MISIGNSMICSDIWHNYHEWYFQFGIQASEIWDNFERSGVVFFAKYHVQIMLLFIYTTAHKRFVIFTCRYLKLSWNTTALSQSNCRNSSCSSIMTIIMITVMMMIIMIFIIILIMIITIIIMITKQDICCSFKKWINFPYSALHITSKVTTVSSKLQEPSLFTFMWKCAVLCRKQLICVYQKYWGETECQVPT